MSGGSELALELTDIVISGTAHPIMTDTYQLQGQGQGGQTARSVATGAGLGSAIGAIAGGGRGAAIGAAAGGRSRHRAGRWRRRGTTGKSRPRNHARISAATSSFAAEAPMSQSELTEMRSIPASL